MTYVKLDQNNSGGYFWLDDSQFDALLADGWVPIEDGWRSRWGRNTQNLAIDIPVDDPQHAVTIAKIEFARVTAEDPDDIGCTCCGPPFSFDAVEADDYDYEAVVKAFIPVAEAVEIEDDRLLGPGA